MKIQLSKPILDTKGQKVTYLEYDYGLLKMSDLEKVEQLYFTLTNCLDENILYRCTTTFHKICMFISCQNFNKDLSFINFMNIDGLDGKIIRKISEQNFFKDLVDKKKDMKYFST